ncbi:MAG TPA: peptidyl-prolyl cis-trans isomerase [Myxococcota bacterium]|nr:peptidyl-prolyl cis-trans isomerase [Myxococcota bacterium]
MCVPPMNGASWRAVAVAGAVVSVAVALLAAAVAACQGAPPAPAPHVAARVNGEPIALWEVAREYHRRPAAADATPDERLAQARRVLDEMIEQRLLVTEARRRGLWPTAAAVDAAYAARAADYPTPKEFMEALVEQGHTVERFRELLGERLAVDRLLAEVHPGDPAAAAPAAVEAYYKAHPDEFLAPEQARALHIVVATAEEAKQIRDEILKGADFAALARARSLGPEAAEGGDLGYFPKGVMPDGFDVVFGLAAGTMSATVETDSGFHLFKVVDKRDAYLRGLPEVEDAIRRKLAGPALAAEEGAFIAKLRETATIEVDENVLRELR